MSTREQTKAVGHIINALRALEAAVGRLSPQNDHTMRTAALHIEEATRLMVVGTQWEPEPPSPYDLSMRDAR